MIQPSVRRKDRWTEKRPESAALAIGFSFYPLAWPKGKNCTLKFLVRIFIESNANFCKSIKRLSTNPDSTIAIEYSVRIKYAKQIELKQNSVQKYLIS